MRKNVYYRTDRGQRLGAGRHALKATREVIHVTKGDTVRVEGWELTVLDTEHHRAERVAITAPAVSATDEEKAR